MQIFNALKVSRLRDFYSQPRKDNYRHAFVIFQMLRYGQVTAYTPLRPATRALEQSTRYPPSLLRAKANVKTGIRAILDQVFQEHQQSRLFSSLFGASSLALPKRFSTRQKLATTSQGESAQFLPRRSRDHLGSRRAALILQKARCGEGFPASADAFAATCLTRSRPVSDR